MSVLHEVDRGLSYMTSVEVRVADSVTQRVCEIQNFRFKFRTLRPEGEEGEKNNRMQTCHLWKAPRARRTRQDAGMK